MFSASQKLSPLNYVNLVVSYIVILSNTKTETLEQQLSGD